MASADRPIAGYPLHLNVTGRTCLVVGAGRVATRRVAGLLEAGALVRIVATECTPEIRRLVDRGRIELRGHRYRPSDLDGCALAFAATDDGSLNRRVADDAGAAGVPANVADDLQRSDFTVPAVLRRGPLSVAVASGGAAPVLARRLRDELEPLIGDSWGRAAELLHEARAGLKEAIDEASARSTAVDRALRDALDGRPAGDDLPSADELVRRVGTRDWPGHVALVGAGPGDPDLLTLRAATMIGRADVIVHDRLGTEAILPLAAPGAELIDVGKEPGRHGMTQDEISALLIRLAGEGRRVVRLKGGDPFVFGRGGEEALALAAACVAFEVVPGISSAIGAVTAAGIPVTHRSVSQSVTIASGHDDPHSPAAAARWAALGGAPGTLVLLMAMANLAEIAAALEDAGRSPDEPVCALQWATTTRERRVEATLSTIADACAAAALGSPAIVVVGPVVEVGRRVARALTADAPTASAPRRR